MTQPFIVHIIRTVMKIVCPLAILLVLIGCNNCAPCIQSTPDAQPEFTPTASIITSTITPTEVLSQPKTIYLEPIKTDSNNPYQLNTYMNLWTKIEQEKISIYAINRLSDFIYDKNGALWIVGGFGVIKRDLEGNQTSYSIKNGLPKNFFTRVALSPTGEVWIGGADNALFRFDGAQWIDEGERIPPSFDDRTHYLCYSKDISGIDFDPEGSVWVMNSGIEIYRQAYGQWINVPFPKELLPVAGGGACPIGMRVKSDQDITIELSGCCGGGPTGYQFDGQTWTKTDNYAAIEELVASRHTSPINSLLPSQGYIFPSFTQDWLIDEATVLPWDLSYPSSSFATVDQHGMVWLNDSIFLYNNANGKFRNVQSVNDHTIAGDQGDPDLHKSDVLNFDTRVLFYENGKRPNLLSWVVNYASMEGDMHYATDSQDRIWFYDADNGLVTVDHGVVRLVSHIPYDLFQVDIGGIFVAKDGRIWVGSIGVIWEYDQGNWQKYIVPDADELFTHFAENSSGVLYGATDTSVYQFTNGKSTQDKFVGTGKKPIVLSDTGKLLDWQECTFHKRYMVFGNCPGNWWNSSTDYRYKAILLKVQEDGSVIYINNHIIAKFDGKNWSGFVFDTFAINSATVDKEGNIWIFCGSEGLIRLSSDIFNDYQGLQR